MEYEPVFGLAEIAKRFNDASHDTTNHFVEGLQYSLDEAVIMTAVMVADHEVDHRNVRLNQRNQNFILYFFLLKLDISSSRLITLANGINHGSSNMSKIF